MREIPILFSAEMVRAILEDCKTQTRRVFRSPDHDYRYGEIGDRLWVRETWQTHCDQDHIRPRDLAPTSYIQYPATYDEWASKRRPGNIMPRWASRITLEVTDKRRERLRNISEEDAIAEGIKTFIPPFPVPADWPRRRDGKLHPAYGTEFHENRERFATSPVAAFGRLWDKINGKKYPWDSNPWVEVTDFRRVTP